MYKFLTFVLFQSTGYGKYAAMNIFKGLSAIDQANKSNR